MKDNRVTVIILAGGQGSRLYPLTKTRSKPAVPIGGKFRLIDIPISNSLHSGYRHIWIVTQFASESLHRHIFSTYRLDSFAKGFISILAASQTADDTSWYQGTADAVRKNLRFFENAYSNILILSGDHLYRMDYKKFLDFHLEHDAGISISVIPITRDRVPELGIMKIDNSSQITDFKEKPSDQETIDQFMIPDAIRANYKKTIGLNDNQTHLASMGIYLFKKELLFDLLISNNYLDFGKEIIPLALKKEKVFAYPFTGYWEDIGTIGAFFDAHISLTREIPEFNFYDEDKPIFSHPRFLPAAKINAAQIESSIISEGSIIDRSFIRDCVIGVRSIIRKNCVLERVVVMGNDYYEHGNQNMSDQTIPLGIGENSVIKNAILDKNVRIGTNVHLINRDGVSEGERDDILIKNGIIVLPKSTSIPSNTVI